jgi:PAS domain S-box-containing protein
MGAPGDSPDDPRAHDARISPTRAAEVSQIVKVTGRHEGVNAQRESDEGLHIGEGRFRSLLPYLQRYALIMLDPRGRVSSWSAEAERVSGYASQEVLGLPSSLFYTAHDLALNKPYEDLVLATTHGRHEFEGWRVRKGGGRIWAHVVTTTLLDPYGALVGFSEVSRDISARKRTMDALEQRVEKFQRSSGERERSIWAVVHELQGPLRLIASSTSLLASRYAGRLNAEADELIRCAADETHRMQRLIRDLFAGASITAARREVVVGEVQPRLSLYRSRSDATKARERI